MNTYYSIFVISLYLVLKHSNGKSPIGFMMCSLQKFQFSTGGGSSAKSLIPRGRVPNFNVLLIMKTDIVAKHFLKWANKIVKGTLGRTYPPVNYQSAIEHAHRNSYLIYLSVYIYIYITVTFHSFL